jgi:hypothetical protein
MMAKGKVLIHIGGPKTGTTAIQTALAENRHALRERGILYPGTGKNQQNALYPLKRIAGFQNFVSGDRLGWEQLVDEVNQWEGVVLLSSEALLSIPTDVVNEIVDTVGTSQTEILITARSLHELVVSHWQELVKAGGTISLRDYASEIGRGPKNATDSSLIFWLVADYVTPIQRWSQRLGIENMIVQCVDTTKHYATLRSFEQIAEIPSGLLRTSAQDVVNQSLTYAEVELIRSCNEILLEDSVSDHDYSTLKAKFRRKILSQLPDEDGAKIELPTSYYESIATFVNTEVQRVVDSGARIHGDISLLTRIPQTFSDSRDTDLKLDQDLIKSVLRQILPNP